jgi:hypothetical protein
VKTSSLTLIYVIVAVGSDRHVVAQVLIVQELCCRPGGRGFSFRRRHSIFHMTYPFEPHNGPGNLPGRKADNLSAICEPTLENVGPSTPHSRMGLDGLFACRLMCETRLACRNIGGTRLGVCEQGCHEEYLDINKERGLAEHGENRNRRRLAMSVCRKY